MSVQGAEGKVLCVEAGDRVDEGLEVVDREPPLGGQAVLDRERPRGRSSALLEDPERLVGCEEASEFERTTRTGRRGGLEECRDLAGADVLDPGGTIDDRGRQERSVRRPEQDRDELVAEVDLTDQDRVVAEHVEWRHEGIVAGLPRSSAAAERAGERSGGDVVREDIGVVRDGGQDLVDPIGDVGAIEEGQTEQ